MTSAVLLPPRVMSDCDFIIRESFTLSAKGDSKECKTQPVSDGKTTPESSKLSNCYDLTSDSHDSNPENSLEGGKSLPSKNVILIPPLDEISSHSIENSDDNYNSVKINGSVKMSESETNDRDRPGLRLRNLEEIGVSTPIPAESVSELIILSESEGEEDGQDKPTGKENDEKNTSKSSDHSYFNAGVKITKIMGVSKKNSGDGSAELVPVIQKNITEPKLCLQCNEVVMPMFTVVLDNQDTAFICSSNCGEGFKFAQQASLSRVNSSSEAILASQKGRPKKLCSSCAKDIGNCDSALCWETMDYCNETCLKHYFNKIGNLCSTCQKMVPEAILGKYSVRFGSDIRQFCQSQCLEEFKKNLKVCSYCQEDISSVPRFLASINDKVFRDFCSKECITYYERINSSAPIRLCASNCAVCSKWRLVTVDVSFGDEQFKLCSEVCFSAFKFVHPFSKMGFCDLCKKYFDVQAIPKPFIMFHDDAAHMFCSKMCFNVFVMLKRKIVQCNWCKVKKYNFDMIKRMFSSKQVMMYCSFNCYTTWKLSPKRNTCDNCSVFGMIMYHLGMSDGTLRSFCGQECLMAFQLQFKKIPVTPLDARPMSKALSLNSSNKQPEKTVTNSSTNVPPIQSCKVKFNLNKTMIGSIQDAVNSKPLEVVVNGSLAEKTLEPPSTPEPPAESVSSIPVETPSSTSPKVVTLAPAPSSKPACKGVTTAICQVIFVPQEKPKMCNKTTMFTGKGPSMKSKSAMCSPITFTKCTQTDFEVEQRETISSSDATFVVSTSSKDEEEPEVSEEPSALNQTYVVCQGRPDKRTLSIDGSEDSGGKRRRLNSDSSGGSGAMGGSSNVGGASNSGSQCPPGGSGGSGDRPPTPNTPPSPPTPPSPEHKYLKIMEDHSYSQRSDISPYADGRCQPAAPLGVSEKLSLEEVKMISANWKYEEFEQAEMLGSDEELPTSFAQELEVQNTEIIENEDSDFDMEVPSTVTVGSKDSAAIERPANVNRLISLRDMGYQIRQLGIRDRKEILGAVKRLIESLVSEKEAEEAYEVVDKMMQPRPIARAPAFRGPSQPLPIGVVRVSVAQPHRIRVRPRPKGASNALGTKPHPRSHTCPVCRRTERPMYTWMCVACLSFSKRVANQPVSRRPVCTHQVCVPNIVKCPGCRLKRFERERARRPIYRRASRRVDLEPLND